MLETAKNVSLMFRWALLVFLYNKWEITIGMDRSKEKINEHSPYNRLLRPLGQVEA